MSTAIELSRVKSQGEALKRVPPRERVVDFGSGQVDHVPRTDVHRIPCIALVVGLIHPRAPRKMRDVSTLNVELQPTER